MELSALFCAAKYPSMTSYFALVFLAGFLPLSVVPEPPVGETVFVCV